MYSWPAINTGWKVVDFIMRWLVLSAALVCIGCGGDESDTVAPVVSITKPTSGSSYSSSSTPLTISGTVTDKGGVSSVVWSSSAGNSGTCAGTKSWTAAVVLTEGTNIITVTAEDTAGNSGADRLTVTYTPPTVTLSGKISVPPTNLVDSDVNDEYQSYKANDSIDNAQEVTNPLTLGGFVNRAYSGSIDGRSYNSGDIDDYYIVSLSEGDSVILSISDYGSNNNSIIDLDLYIYDRTGAVLDSSVGDGGLESINNIAYSGVYYVNIHAESGASNYILSIGDQTSSAASGSLPLNRDFVPGQVIIRFKDDVTGITSVQKMSNHISSMGMGMKAGRPGKEALAWVDMSNKKAVFKMLGIPDDRTSLNAIDKKTQSKLDTLLVVKALRSRPDVATADPNYIVHKAALPDDTYFNYQWNLPLINLPDAWDTTTGKSSVIVAVVDTGVLLHHPDLSNQLIGGYDFISDTSISNDGDGIDDNPVDSGDQDNSDGSSSFHGTHVAGIIAAETNNSRGIAGVSWSTLIMPVRVLGVGGGTDYDVLQGVRYAAGLENDSGTVPAAKADIINLSLGSVNFSETDAVVYAEVREAGVIVIAATGNDSSSSSFYPASYDGVVSVSAVDINGNNASYSSHGSEVDVAAPGGDSGDLNGDGYPDYVLSTCGDDSSGSVTYDYAFMAGTSMAAPHVSGVVALMKAVNSSLTSDDLDAFLINGDIVDDYGDEGWDEYYGHGLIDAYKAVLAAEGASPTVLKVSPATLNFGQLMASALLTVSQLGSGGISVTGVTDDATWLTVSALSVDGNGLGAYSVIVNREILSSDGNYSGIITFSSTSNTVEVHVKMQVNKSGILPDAGYHYILLVDSGTQETVDYFDVVAQDGFYSYSFTDVSQGTYEIYAGSDRDCDGYIGDTGESFGAYKSINEPTEIEADQNLAGLDFSTDYLVTLTSSTKADGDTSDYFLRLMVKADKALRIYSQ